MIRDGLTELAYKLIAKHGVDRYPTVGDCLHKLQEEVGELAKAFLRNEPLNDEIADVEICLRILANKAGVDINNAVYKKVESDNRSFV